MKTIVSELFTAHATLERIDPTHPARDAWQEYAKYLMTDAPSGGGFDNGTHLDGIKTGKAESIQMHTHFHHMNEAGYYDGWTDHILTIRPAFDGIDITIGGRDRNGIKDYIADTFYEWLRSTPEKTFSDFFKPTHPAPATN